MLLILDRCHTSCAHLFLYKSLIDNRILILNNQMLDVYQAVDKEALLSFLSNAHTRFGGFSKFPEDDYPGKHLLSVS